MDKDQFIKWMKKNSKSKDVTINKYAGAINVISEEMSMWGFDKKDLFSNKDLQLIDQIMAAPGFVQKNTRGNNMYGAALNHLKNYLLSQEINNESDNSVNNIDDVILIKINKSYHNGMSAEELYHVTSVSWVVSLEKTDTRDIQYYCAVFNDEIIEVYKLTGFEPDPKPGKEKRFILHGEIADDKLRVRLNGLNVTSIHKGRGNPIKYTNLNRLLNEDLGRKDSVEIMEGHDLLSYIHIYITSHGFYYTEKDLFNFYLSLRSKPFVIISGISGTGKTKIVQLFAESIGATEENGQFRLIPVRPDWSDSSDLLGYLTLQEEYKKGPLAEIVEHAMNYPELPHFALLDEMNLARVEYYFSDVLSVMESRKKGEDSRVTSSPLVDPKLYQKDAFGVSPEGPLYLPNNLYIVGTVNMDETTYPFSKKVLDRANTIEFNQIELNHFEFLKEDNEKVQAKVISNENLEACYTLLKEVFKGNQELIKKISIDLEAVNVHLAKINAQVGYRVRDEICFYMVHNEEAKLLSEEEAMDFCYMQKILPRISGGQGVRIVLNGLIEEWSGKTDEGLPKYPKSIAKVEEMLGRLDADGFTSFWIA